MLSGYTPTELTAQDLLPQSETIDMGHLSNADSPWKPHLKFSTKDLLTRDGYFEFLANILTKLQEGPILIIVPSASDIEPLVQMLKEENVHEARSTPWKHRIRHLGTSDQP